MHCHQVNQLLVDYIDGELADSVSQDLEEHLKDCVPCKKFIDTYKATIRITKRIEPSIMPAELKERLHSFMKKQMKPQTKS